MAVRILKKEVLVDDSVYKEVACLSTDDKPVEANLATGSLCLEVDTGDVYAYDEEGNAGSEWLKVAELGGGS